MLFRVSSLKEVYIWTFIVCIFFHGLYMSKVFRLFRARMNRRCTWYIIVQINIVEYIDVDKSEDKEIDAEKNGNWCNDENGYHVTCAIYAKL